MFSRLIQFVGRFGYILSVFHQRNRFLWNIGIAVIVFSIILRAVVKKIRKRSNKKRIESTLRVVTVIGVGILLVSLLGGKGIKIGFGGEGNVIGLGSEREIEAGQAITDETSAIIDADIIIRVCWMDISIDDNILKLDELYEYLRQEYKDQYSVAVVEEYAENETFESVVDAVQRLAISKYRIITIR